MKIKKHKISNGELKIIGEIKRFKGTFELYKTDNIFRFLEKTKKDIIKNNSIFRLGHISPTVKINSKGIIIDILNKKEGLFICKKYPNSIFKFLIKSIYNNNYE